MEVTYTPVPVICSGQIMNYMANTESYEVFIHKSPNDSLMSNIRATAIHHPGLVNNYKKGDYVKVSVMFNFENGIHNKFIGPCNAGTSHIIGLYDERSVLNIKVSNPLTSPDESTLSFVHKENDCGLSVEKNGTTRTVSGATYSLLKGFGYGTSKDLHQTWAQNHIRIIGNNGPYYLAKEHFGLFTGDSLEDQVQKIDDEDFPIIYRRFVPQSMVNDNWVSTCEGAFVPWFGPNNNFDYVEKSKETIFTKIINKDTTRITLEAGEELSFINLRIDSVIEPEKLMTTGKHGASTALLGNRFSLKIDEEGTVDIRAAGKGQLLNTNNTHGFHMSIDDQGNLTIYSKGTITLSHGKDDVSNNSIVLDPKNGIDITAQNGLRFNGIGLINDNFLDWMDINKNNLCLVTAVGAAAPINPIAMSGFENGIKDNNGNVEFTTDKKGSPAAGIIKDDLFFSSI